MDYKQLEQANKEIRTTDIKGKEYAEVNQRIKAFRMIEPNGSIETEIISLNDGVCLMKAVVKDAEGKLLGVGHAYEKENSTFINKTSYIENCETSAVGRALGMLGIGIDTSVASYEEVATAIINQENKKTSQEKDYRNLLINHCKNNGLDLNAISKEYSLTRSATNDDFRKVYEELCKM